MHLKFKLVMKRHISHLGVLLPVSHTLRTVIMFSFLFLNIFTLLLQTYLILVLGKSLGFLEGMGTASVISQRTLRARFGFGSSSCCHP